MDEFEERIKEIRWHYGFRKNMKDFIPEEEILKLLEEVKKDFKRTIWSAGKKMKYSRKI